MKPPLKHSWHPEPEEPRTIETMSVQVDWNDWFKHSSLVLQLCYADEQKIQKTNRAHLIKSLLCGELSHENICVDAFRLSTVKKLAEGKPLVQQMPWAAEENVANNRGGGGPNGKVGIWFTVYHWVHSHCSWQISKSYLHETQLWCFLVSFIQGWAFHLLKCEVERAQDRQYPGTLQNAKFKWSSFDSMLRFLGS